MTYGVYYLARLVAEDPGVWPVVAQRMNLLLADALGVITEFFEPYHPLPFGLTLADTVSYAMARFARRSARIERAKDRGAAMAMAVAHPADEVLEWLEGEVAPRRVEIERTAAGPAVLRVRHEDASAALALSEEVLNRDLADEILSALEEEGAAPRLGGEPGLRLECVEQSGRLVVQPYF
jgi:hypothetical protein